MVLASASPRRHRLLAEAGVSFEIEPADVDESIDASLAAADVAEDLARRKALEVARRRQEAGLAEPLAIVGSDTIVVLGADGAAERRFLEKAEDAVEARRMLEALSGRAIGSSRASPSPGSAPVTPSWRWWPVTRRRS